MGGAIASDIWRRKRDRKTYPVKKACCSVWIALSLPVGAFREKPLRTHLHDR